VIAAAARVITTPQSPWTDLLATAVPLVGAYLAYLAYRLSKRQARAQEAAAERAVKDQADTLETKRQEQMATVVTTVGRLDSAVFGYVRGATRVPGLTDVIVGNGDGTIRDRVTRLAATVEEHVEDDSGRWEEATEQFAFVTRALHTLAEGQKAAAQTADDVRLTAINVAREVADLAVVTAGDVAGLAVATASDVRTEAQSTAADVKHDAEARAAELASGLAAQHDGDSGTSV
jgi:hypothetical protein